ncbi:hypothetical protein [Streptomyces sp. ISL-99]|uniref:hypothetical protein n=1 Tax=Streptomyces sp. ISL-99 TaxID=2819193 RepID=UPI002035DA2B|nr:hypothetical protein [Streptomyces sp. ISL-99]
MPTIATRTAALVGMLTAATGAEPTVDDAPQHVRIEADLPDNLGPAKRHAVLAALDRADRYGHDRTEDRTTVWAELDKGTSHERG